MTGDPRTRHGVVHAAVGGVSIAVKVAPRSSRSGLDGVRDGALRVRLNAPPVEGAANDELIGILAKALGVPRRAVSIEAGERSRTKRVHVAGVGVHAAEEALVGRSGAQPR